jgi:endonuclease/exonuclease/phosphatase family metal-dependent hydrolase
MASGKSSGISPWRTVLGGWFNRSLFVLNLGLAAGMCLVYAAPWLDPRWFAPLALVGFLYYPMLVGCLVMAMWWLIKVDTRALLSLVVLCLGWQVHPHFWKWNLYGGPESVSWNAKKGQWNQPISGEAGDLRIMSYNVGHFTNKKDAAEWPINDIHAKDFLLQLLADGKMDVVGFQDFITWNQDRSDILQRLQQHEAIRNSSVVLIDARLRPSCINLSQSHTSSQSDRASSHRFQGLAIWTRGTILQYDYRSLGEFESATGLLQADIALGSDTVRVLNLHLASNRISGRELKPVQSLDLQSDSSQRGIYQIFRKIAASARLRATQAEQVRRTVDTSPYPVILTGDFNDLPYSYTLGQVGTRLRDSFVEAGYGLGNTYARGFPSFRIDHIMAGPGFTLKAHGVLRVPMSDHYPVVAVLGKEHVFLDRIR